jgi:hypothetical protein
MSSISLNLRPFKADFISGNSEPFGAETGEYMVGVPFQKSISGPQNCLTESALCDGTLSWWRIQSLGQSSGLIEESNEHYLH